MLKRTRFFVGVSLLAQSISFFFICIVLAVKKKSATLVVNEYDMPAGSTLVIALNDTERDISEEFSLY